MSWYPADTAGLRTDLGFPVGGGANPPGDAKLQFCQNLQKKLNEIKNILGRRGRARDTPRSTTGPNCSAVNILGANVI